MPPPAAAEPAYGVVVPVKPPAVAKSRLAGLGDGVRRELVAAFAADTVTAVVACPSVRMALVVTDDHVLAADLADLGARVVPDATTDDLNGSLAQGAAEVLRRDPSLRLAAVFADLPALRPDELAEALVSTDEERLSFVADRQSSGTTMVAAATLAAFRPRFGRASRRAHLDAGGFEISLAVPGLRCDVDTAADLAAAMALGVGPRTSFVVAKHGL